MTGRNVLTKLTSADTPLDLAEDVEAVLEVDKLFWLDPQNRGLQTYQRKLVPGEELPMQLPNGTRIITVKGVDVEVARTVVIVSRRGRLFMVDGVPTLMIEDNAEKVALGKAKKDHKIGDALNDFRKFMAEYTRQVNEERAKRVGQRPSAEERAAQSAKDKLLAAERRERNRTQRAATIAAKRKSAVPAS